MGGAGSRAQEPVAAPAGAVSHGLQRALLLGAEGAAQALCGEWMIRALQEGRHETACY